MNIEFLDYKEENGLVVCQDRNMAKNNAERLYVHEAIKLGVDAILFRRYFNDSETNPYKSEPAVYLFNKEDNFFNSPAHILLHAKLWSAGEIQVYVIKGKTRIDVINARRPAHKNDETGELIVDELLLAQEAIASFDDHRFYALQFGAGTFWEQKKLRDELDIEKTPYRLLLRYLLQTRSYIVKQGVLPLKAHTIDKLLITCILIKFLEEREDDNGRSTLKEIYSQYQITDFSEGIEQGLILTILAQLASTFNGKIFNRFTEGEKSAIDNANLQILAGFLRGNINPSTQSYFLWKQYDFKYLPAEVISAIYENFIQEESKRQIGTTEKGIVYTPIHLVNLLIDETMPLEKPELFKDGQFSILDPTCGSGVFLVAAYKRLLQWWALNNSTNSRITYPTSDTAIKILEDNIFGVDVKETATFVTIFGLTTALLDKLTPQEIWNNLKSDYPFTHLLYLQ